MYGKGRCNLPTTIETRQVFRDIKSLTKSDNMEDILLEMIELYFEKNPTLKERIEKLEELRNVSCG